MWWRFGRHDSVCGITVLSLICWQTLPTIEDHFQGLFDIHDWYWSPKLDHNWWLWCFILDESLWWNHVCPTSEFFEFVGVWHLCNPSGYLRFRQKWQNTPRMELNNTSAGCVRYRDLSYFDPADILPWLDEDPSQKRQGKERRVRYLLDFRLWSYQVWDPLPSNGRLIFWYTTLRVCHTIPRIWPMWNRHRSDGWWQMAPRWCLPEELLLSVGSRQ